MANRMPYWSVIWGISTRCSPTAYLKGVLIILDHLIFAGDTAKDCGARESKVKLLKVLDRMAINAASLVVLDTKEHQTSSIRQTRVW